MGDFLWARYPCRVVHTSGPLTTNTPLLLKLTEVPLLLSDVPLSTFVSVGSALLGLRSRLESNKEKKKKVTIAIKIITLKPRVLNGSRDAKGTTGTVVVLLL